jgi:Ser/Thr protein kinase RdoA (MazF antagonist)
LYETKEEMAELEALLEGSRGKSGEHIESLSGVVEWLSAERVVQNLQGLRAATVATVNSKLEPRVALLEAIVLHGRFYVAVDAGSYLVQQLAERPAISLTCAKEGHALIAVHGTASFLHVGEPGFRDVDAEWVKFKGRDWGKVVFIKVEPSSMVAYVATPGGFVTRDSAAEDHLRAHLEKHYDIRVAGLNRLDAGVFRVDLHEGRSWIARLFPPERAVERVEGDAEVLRFLEEHGFPAERCANPDPVSTLEGRGLLVTEYVEATAVEPSEPTLHALGEMLGRLNSLPAWPGGVAREAGSLHHYSSREGGPRNELDAAVSWLDAVGDRVPAQNRALHESLRGRVARADDLHDLPKALIHPDPVLKNAVATPDAGLVWIDWTGAGRGPRLLPLTVLTWSSALTKDGWEPRRVDAIVAGYRSHVHLQEDELARFADATRISTLVFACWRYRHAMLSGRPPDGPEWWWPSDELIEAVAARARAAFKGALQMA